MKACLWTMRVTLCHLCFSLVFFPVVECFVGVCKVLGHRSNRLQQLPPHVHAVHITSLGNLRCRSSVGRTTTSLPAEKHGLDLGDVKRGLASSRDRLEKNKKLLDEAKLRGELEYLENMSSQAGFWDDATTAKKTMSSANRYNSSSSCRYTPREHIVFIW